ncbi:hypothetical protein OG429_20145 [Streptomyces sp. NBC_00190]|uniref:hypothetical protein n=1 Tax=unclassified Streptomyces TaxID=2593676 RepID=UPI002E2AEF88|nr:hypothetical protein [Streptomyces sp. NBC_00190]WSZ41382.1 hypothetical protein OG239_22930 [Streptomyces sp. NBC_00868]
MTTAAGAAEADQARTQVHPVQRAIASAALLLGCLATVWSLGVGTAGAFVVPLLALTAPVLVRSGVGFRRLCTCHESRATVQAAAFGVQHALQRAGATGICCGPDLR